jgi:hypothetical protein
VDKSLRKQAFIIESQSGILWLAPIRRSALAPITAQTKHILALTVQNNIGL